MQIFDSFQQLFWALCDKGDDSGMGKVNARTDASYIAYRRMAADWIKYIMVIVRHELLILHIHMHNIALCCCVLCESVHFFLLLSYEIYWFIHICMCAYRGCCCSSVIVFVINALHLLSAAYAYNTHTHGVLSYIFIVLVVVVVVVCMRVRVHVIFDYPRTYMWHGLTLSYLYSHGMSTWFWDAVYILFISTSVLEAWFSILLSFSRSLFIFQ